MRPVNLSDETGSVVIEFVGFGILLQLPILMFAVSLIGAQHDQFAAEAITRDALRSFVLLDKSPSDIAAEVSAAYRVPLARVSVSMTCTPSDCESEASWIEITTRIGSAVARGSINR